MRRVIPVIAVVFDNRLLMIQRGAESKYPNQWCIPGGKVEEGETVEQCAVRELREETGIDAPALNWPIEHVTNLDAANPDLEFSLFLVRPTVRPRVRIEDGFEGHGWFTVSEIIALAAMEPARSVAMGLGVEP